MPRVCFSVLASSIFALPTIFFAGCVPTVHLSTPRAFVAPETSEVLGIEHVAVSGSYAAATSENPSQHAGAARFRIGVAQDLELNVDGSLGWGDFAGGEIGTPVNMVYTAQRDSRFQGTGRVGIKYRLVRGLSAGVGLGGGGYAGGFLGSVDASLTAAYENEYVVPFGTARVGYAGALASRAIAFEASKGGANGARFTNRSDPTAISILFCKPVPGSRFALRAKWSRLFM